MRTLIENRELASQLAEHGHRMTREHYSLDLMLERMDRLYRRLATPRPR